MDEINPQQWRNAPETWSRDYPWSGNKRSQIFPRACRCCWRCGNDGGGEVSRARCHAGGSGHRLRLRSQRSLRLFIGLPFPGAIIHPVRDTGAFIEIVEDERVAACLVGPGNGINVSTRSGPLRRCARSCQRLSTPMRFPYSRRRASCSSIAFKVRV